MYRIKATKNIENRNQSPLPAALPYRMLKNKIASSMPDFLFVDKAGRRWNSQAYFSMLTHTVMATTYREIYANTLANEGDDLVKITQNGARDACKK
jgi:hypothetical protein